MPTNCVATSTQAPGQLVISNATLVAVWTGAVNTWEELVQREAHDRSGDAISGAGCVASTPITRVVHLNQSGDTYVFKRHLGLSSAAKVSFEDGKGEPIGEKGWNEVTEGSENLSWPIADKVATGATEEAETTVENLISYVTATEPGAGQEVIVGHNYFPLR